MAENKHMLEEYEKVTNITAKILQVKLVYHITVPDDDGVVKICYCNL
jgi:nitrate reductase NapAB chaperone NapD